MTRVSAVVWVRGRGGVERGSEGDEEGERVGKGKGVNLRISIKVKGNCMSVRVRESGRWGAPYQ